MNDNPNIRIESIEVRCEPYYTCTFCGAVKIGKTFSQNLESLREEVQKPSDSCIPDNWTTFYGGNSETLYRCQKCGENQNA